MKDLKYNPEYPFKPFIFIGEKLIKAFDTKKPFLKNYFLKYADDQQILAIKKLAKIDEMFKIKMSENHINIYEHSLIIRRKPGSISTTPFPLKPNSFEYSVIELSELLRDYNLFPSISLLTKNLTVIIEVGQIGAYRFDHLKAAVFYSDFDLIHNDPIEINQKDINELELIYNSIEAFYMSSYKDSIIGKALNDFLNIGHIPYKSPFKIIALFSIIELLLTTNNKNSDQSINKQLQKKIKLLNNQLTNKVDFRNYFSGSDSLTEEIIIEKLYSYRSKIAHGDYYDFNNELQVLGNHKNIFEYLNLLTKRLLTYSINNCQLIVDLKEC